MGTPINVTANKLEPRHYRQIGIPLNKVGERLEQLNEAIKNNNMAIKAESKIELDYSRNETALAVQLTVYLFDDEEDKKDVKL